MTFIIHVFDQLHLNLYFQLFNNYHIVNIQEFHINYNLFFKIYLNLSKNVSLNFLFFYNDVLINIFIKLQIAYQQK